MGLVPNLVLCFFMFSSPGMSLFVLQVMRSGARLLRSTGFSTRTSFDHECASLQDARLSPRRASDGSGCREIIGTRGGLILSGRYILGAVFG